MGLDASLTGEAGEGLRFGVVYPNYGEYCRRELAAKVAAAADGEGFDAFLVWDHYMLPWGNCTFDAWMFLCHAAALTQNIRLGTCVTPIPFRPPALLAKMVATLDLLSDGRAIVGVGAGWHQPEFEGYSHWESDKTRVAKTREGLELLVKLWTEGRVDFRGKFYAARGAVLEPKPVQKPHPPLWFGTTGRYLLNLAGRIGAGWIPTELSPGEYARYAAQLRSALGSRRKFTFAYNLFTPETDAEAFIRTIEKYEKAGCGYLAVNWRFRPEELLERLRWFAREIMPSFTE